MKNRVLFATDVPFWWQSTGAEQRIFGIYRYLKQQGCTCGVCYLNKLDAADEELISSNDLNIFAVSSDQPPEKISNRIRWYADATINQARNWLASDELVAVVDGPPSLTLDDFVWPWALARFGEIASEFDPDCIIIEYIKLAYLLDALSSQQRAQIKCLIDTHDVLHKRAEQFFAHGFPHWLDIDREGEAEVLGKFDAIIAIQEQEAATFREMTDSRVPTLTVGHAVDVEEVFGDEDLDEIELNAVSPDKITVGYIGSKNFSNWQAIRDFLNCAWPSVVVKNQAKCELVVAGGICEWFETDADGKLTLNDQLELPDNALDRVQLLGRVDSLAEFYDRIDVVINPVQFGTGLKIKNAESLRFGKLLITTLNGFDGMPEATRLACMVVEDVNEMGLAINSICNNLSLIRPMQQLALQLAQTEFSGQYAYSELETYLNTILSG